VEEGKHGHEALPHRQRPAWTTMANDVGSELVQLWHLAQHSNVGSQGLFGLSPNLPHQKIGMTNTRA
jgi:hypothetical protein